MIILRIIFVNVIDHNGYETNMLRRLFLFLAQATTSEYMYIYVAISAGGILVVMATIVVVGCIYRQGKVLLKRRYLTLWLRRVSVITFTRYSQNQKTGKPNNSKVFVGK